MEDLIVASCDVDNSFQTLLAKNPLLCFLSWPNTISQFCPDILCGRALRRTSSEPYLLCLPKLHFLIAEPHSQRNKRRLLSKYVEYNPLALASLLRRGRMTHLLSASRKTLLNWYQVPCFCIKTLNYRISFYFDHFFFSCWSAPICWRHRENLKLSSTFLSP